MPVYLAPQYAPVWFDLMSDDPDKVAPFYKSVFGWNANEPRPDFGGYRNFTAGGALVAGLMPTMPGASMGNVWTIYFRSNNIDADAIKLTDAGAVAIAPPMAVGDLGKMAVFADPIGTVFGLWESGTHEGFTAMGDTGTPYWFELVTNNYDASKEFYSKVFGWKTESVPTEVAYTMVGASGQDFGGILDGASFVGAGIPPHWRVYVTVADAAVTAQTVVDEGGTVLAAPEATPYGTLATIADPLNAVCCFGVAPEGMSR